MFITLNGQKIETQQTTLKQLLSEQGYADLSVATAVDGEFVTVAERHNTNLNEHCVVEIVAPMQGG